MKKTKQVKKEDETPKNNTPTLCTFIADKFGGWYLDGLLRDRKFVISRSSVKQFPDAKSRIQELNAIMQPLWKETWDLDEIVIAD